MLNIVWPGFIIVSIIFAILSGNIKELVRLLICALH